MSPARGRPPRRRGGGAAGAGRGGGGRRVLRDDGLRALGERGDRSGKPLREAGGAPGIARPRVFPRPFRGDGGGVDPGRVRGRGGQGRAASSDVVVETEGGHRMGSLGLGYEVLSRENPALVHLTLSTYGSFGPDAGRRVTDSHILCHALSPAPPRAPGRGRGPRGRGGRGRITRSPPKPGTGMAGSPRGCGGLSACSRRLCTGPTPERGRESTSRARRR